MEILSVRHGRASWHSAQLWCRRVVHLSSSLSIPCVWVWGSKLIPSPPAPMAAKADSYLDWLLELHLRASISVVSAKWQDADKSPSSRVGDSDLGGDPTPWSCRTAIENALAGALQTTDPDFRSTEALLDTTLQGAGCRSPYNEPTGGIRLRPYGNFSGA